MDLVISIGIPQTEGTKIYFDKLTCTCMSNQKKKKKFRLN